MAFRVGTLNVRTLGEEGVGRVDDVAKTVARLPLYLEEFSRQNLKVCFLQECRVRGPVETHMEGYCCFFSNVPEGPRHHGVGIVMKKDWAEMVTAWKYISGRIMWVAGCFEGVNMAFICHYAPTMATSYLELKEHGNMVSIDEHYRQLSQALQDIPKEFDRVYLGGDANGRIGRVDREV
jgi:hypothetical protein